ncbi:hypothetical protein I6Y99_005000 [Vibrio parahaemolyticus]|uniref:hypothetical protein n=1 Tax=Vibrio parahaemolyticus TaxID=670 RepID=UPI0009AB411F|nr:hypothetical protein [Vibrio parahaemolyticus]EGQ7810931.1 hypothetical protein [Vibrio parahaemolyticus]EGQ8536383.1 hypothetical protein [Vibrio parahaemolyticus]EHD0108211.1 hypothetical protein [Vibrio parahaemolyticus]EIV8651586.1 hypothetical protein [Vibrio parahaemolyticus]EJE4735906.1 hypothetical protein [Vibrio parahaemolyticus]
MNKRFLSRFQFKRWLRSASALAISISVLYGDYEKARIESSDSKSLYSMVSAKGFQLPKGQYLVSYEPVSDLEDTSIDYSKMVMVMTLEAQLARSKRIIGTKAKLLNALIESNFKFVMTESDDSSFANGMWVVEPQVPEEIEELKGILDAYAMAYAFNDGTDTINLNNFKFNRKSFELG